MRYSTRITSRPRTRPARRAEHPHPAGTSAPGDRDEPAEDHRTRASRVAMPPASPVAAVASPDSSTRRAARRRSVRLAAGGLGQLARAVSWETRCGLMPGSAAISRTDKGPGHKLGGSLGCGGRRRGGELIGLSAQPRADPRPGASASRSDRVSDALQHGPAAPGHRPARPGPALRDLSQPRHPADPPKPILSGLINEYTKAA